MSRRQRGNGEETFRVTVEHQTADGKDVYWTEVFGPYATLSAAKGRLTARLTEASRGYRKVSGFIERAETKWKKVDA